MNSVLQILKILIFLFGFVPLTNWANEVANVTEWISEEELVSTNLEMGNNNLFPCNIEGKAGEDKLFYRASYCLFFPDMHSFYTKWGLPQDAYEKWSEYHASIGMVEHFHTIFIDLDGATVHQSTWILIGESQFETEAEDYAEEE